MRGLGEPRMLCCVPALSAVTPNPCPPTPQAAWDRNPNLTESNVEVNERGAFSARWRKKHKTSPALVPWMSGVVPDYRRRVAATWAARAQRHATTPP